MIDQRTTPIVDMLDSGADVAQHLIDCMREIPGYDIFATAGDGDYFDAESAINAIGFIESLTHIEGAVAGQALVQSRWQRALVAAVFGWRRSDGKRRFRRVFVYVPRKNAKTTTTAAITNCCLFTDDEPGAQIIFAAAERDQASILYSMCLRMIKANPYLDSMAEPKESVKSIMYPARGSWAKAVSAEAKTKHGYNPHVFIIDELHAQPDGKLIEALETGQGAREQPLAFYLTTADELGETVCNEEYDYARDVRDGIIADRAYLPVIYEASKDDDWTSEETWAKANPNYGLSVRVEFLREECEKAKLRPSKQESFKRLYLNVRTNAVDRWLNMDHWDAGEREIDSSPGGWFGAADLSTNTDLTAIARAKIVGDELHIAAKAWLPQSVFLRHQHSDRVPYQSWLDRGLIGVCPGDTIDQTMIQAEIMRWSELHSIKTWAFDRNLASRLTKDLDADGLDVAPFAQSMIGYTPAMQSFERYALAGKVIHGGNPLLKWAFSNVIAVTDDNENLKPSKKKSSARIDPAVAVIMATGMHLTVDDHGEMTADDVVGMFAGYAAGETGDEQTQAERFYL